MTFNLMDLDEETVRALGYALGAYIPNDHYKGWKKAVRALNSALEASTQTTKRERKQLCRPPATIR